MTESTELKAVLFAGEKLSNIAFNLRQRPGEPLSDTFASALRDAFGEWDTAIAAYRRASLAEGKAEPAQDTVRFEWYFGTKPKGDWLMTYLDGMKAGWTANQWRAAIDAAMSQDGAVQAATSGGER